MWVGKGKNNPPALRPNSSQAVTTGGLSFPSNAIHLVSDPTHKREVSVLGFGVRSVTDFPRGHIMKSWITYVGSQYRVLNPAIRRYELDVQSGKINSPCTVQFKFDDGFETNSIIKTNPSGGRSARKN